MQWKPHVHPWQVCTLLSLPQDVHCYGLHFTKIYTFHIFHPLQIAIVH